MYACIHSHTYTKTQNCLNLQMKLKSMWWKVTRLITRKKAICLSHFQFFFLLLLLFFPFLVVYHNFSNVYFCRVSFQAYFVALNFCVYMYACMLGWDKATHTHKKAKKRRNTQNPIMLLLFYYYRHRKARKAWMWIERIWETTYWMNKKSMQKKKRREKDKKRRKKKWNFKAINAMWRITRYA